MNSLSVRAGTAGWTARAKAETTTFEIGSSFLERIVERTAFENGLGDVSARTTQENSVTVRAGASDRGGTERTASSPLVFNHHRTDDRPHLLGPRTPHGVVSSARGERNDESDRTIGVFRLSGDSPRHRQLHR